MRSDEDLRLAFVSGEESNPVSQLYRITRSPKSGEEYSVPVPNS